LILKKVLFTLKKLYVFNADVGDVCVAIRLIRIKLQVTKIEPPGSGEEDEDGEYGAPAGTTEGSGDGLDWSGFEGERLPVVHFRGTSRSLHASWDPNANSRIRGMLLMVTGDQEVVWLNTSFKVPCAKHQKAKSAGRLSPSFTAKSGGGLKVFKSAACDRREGFWGVGSISASSSHPSEALPS